MSGANYSERESNTREEKNQKEEDGVDMCNGEADDTVN